MNSFLDAAELEQLTGYKYAADQIRWLRAKGIYFWINAKGRPAVPWSSVSREREEVVEIGDVR